MQGESPESAEMFRSWRFFVFLYWSIKVTASIREITNNECLRCNTTRLSQFLSILVSRDPSCYLKAKSWFDSAFCFFVHWELVLTLLKSNPTFYLVKIQSFLNFPPIPQIRSAGRIRNRQKFLNLENFSFSFIEVLKSVNENSERNLTRNVSQCISC